MNIRDIMNKNLVVCGIEEDISSISSKMLSNDVGLVLVYDRNHIVGVITDRDIACRVFSNNDPDFNITDYMSREIISIDVNSDILSVLDLMKKYRIKRILVTDSNKVVGVLAISDLLNIDEYSDEVFETIKCIFKIGPNKHKYETEIDEFYL